MPRRFVPRALRGQLSTQSGSTPRTRAGRPAGRRPAPPKEAEETGPDPAVRESELADDPTGGRATSTVRTPSRPSRPTGRPAEDSGKHRADADDTRAEDEDADGARRPSPRPRRRPSPRPRDADETETETETADGADDQEDEEGAPRRPRVKAPARPGGVKGKGRTTRKRDRGGKPPSRNGGRSSRGRAALERAARQRRMSLLRRAALVLGLVAVLAAGGAGVTAFLAHRADATDAASDDATAAAQAAAVAILSYNYQTFDAGVKRAEKYIAGSFGKQYAKSMAELKSTAIKEKASVVARVSATGVVSATPDSVVLMVFVDQYRQNTNIDGQKVDQNRVELKLDHTPHGWKVTKVTAM